MTDEAPTTGPPSADRLNYSPLRELEDARSERVAALISGLLRWGVRASLTLFIVGTLIGFTLGRDHNTTAKDLGRLTGKDGEFPRDLSWLVHGILEGRGTTLIVVGLLLLIATPVLRVALSLVVFATQKERPFVVVTALVLILLVLSFVLGGVET